MSTRRLELFAAAGFPTGETLDPDSLAFTSASVLAVPDWVNPGSPVLSAPAVGGRMHQHRREPIGTRTLAYLGTRADVFNGGSNAALSDVANDDSPFGLTTLTITTTPTTLVTIAPAVVNTVTTNVTNGMIRVLFKPLQGNFANTDRLQLELYSGAATPASPGTDFHTIDASGGLMPGGVKGRYSNVSGGVGRWQWLMMPANQFVAAGAGADLTAIKWAQFKQRSSSGNVVKSGIAKIEFVPNGLTKAKHIFGFDDANIGSFTFALPIMARYGFRGILYPSSIPADVGANPAVWYDAQQIRTLQDLHGWQIGSQAWSTEAQAYVDGLTDDQRTAELSKLRNWHNSQGFMGGDHGSFFSGVAYSDNVAYQMFRQHHRTMRSFGTGQGAGTPFTYGEMYPWGDNMNIQALSGETYADSGTITALQAHIDQAISNVGVSFMVWHHPETYPLSFAAVCAYLDAHRSTIDVCTEEDLNFGHAV